MTAPRLDTPVCRCGCPGEDHDTALLTAPCHLCHCPAWVDRAEQPPPSMAALGVCAVALLLALAALAWQDDRCHAQASTAAGHELCRDLGR